MQVEVTRTCGEVDHTAPPVTCRYQEWGSREEERKGKGKEVDRREIRKERKRRWRYTIRVSL